MLSNGRPTFEGFCSLRLIEGVCKIYFSVVFCARAALLLELKRREEQEVLANQRRPQGYSPALASTQWLPEYPCFMIETTPGAPFDLGPESLRQVEPSVRSRRIKLRVRPFSAFICCAVAFPEFRPR